MAAASIRPIFEAIPLKYRAVVWLVPSETILSQTYGNLMDAGHPYRQRLERDFHGRVEVYGKEQLLAGQNFSAAAVGEQLSVFVLSYDSFRTKSKEGRKAYQENGNLAAFVSELSAGANAPFGGADLLPDVDPTALIQAIRSLHPLVIVDESHHAVTPLSLEMLQNFNPSFVLELTATPKKDSNIISYVPARRLKDENMVKLPVIVYPRQSQGEAIEGAIHLRHVLEEYAKGEVIPGKPPIRPIVLFQAETAQKGKEDRVTFDRIKANLVKEHGIPEEEIAIKTATVNDLKGVDLMAANCSIRYIITINALKEGWDCPFAYVLASLANRTSPVEVEQILGRILRRPYARQMKNEFLNLCYVFTASEDFRQTLDNIVAGLNQAGFSEREYRLADEPTEEGTKGEQGNLGFEPPMASGIPLQELDAQPLTEPASSHGEIPVPTQGSEGNAGKGTSPSEYEIQPSSGAILPQVRRPRAFQPGGGTASHEGIPMEGLHPAGQGHENRLRKSCGRHFRRGRGGGRFAEIQEADFHGGHVLPGAFLQTSEGAEEKRGHPDDGFRYRPQATTGTTPIPAASWNWARHGKEPPGDSAATSWCSTKGPWKAPMPSRISWTWFGICSWHAGI